MSRRRARAAFGIEEPIKATRIEVYEQAIRGSFDLLSRPDADALAALASIAKTYCDGRQIEARKFKRYDCRKTLEVLSGVSSHAGAQLTRLSENCREWLGQVARDNLADGDTAIVSIDISRAVNEVVDAVDYLELRDPTELDTLTSFRDIMVTLAERCYYVPLDADQVLCELQQYAPLLPIQPLQSNYLLDLCVSLSQHCWVAANLMKFDRGPSSDTVRMRAVTSLVGEFERTGGNATHYPKGTTGYDGVGKSSLDQFVHRFFADIELKNTQRRGVNDAIRFACSNKSRALQADISLQTGERERLILSLFKQAAVTNFSTDGTAVSR